MPENKTYTSEEVAALLEHLKGKNDPKDNVSYGPGEIGALMGSANRAAQAPVGPGESVMKPSVQGLPQGSRVVSTPTQVFEPRAQPQPSFEIGEVEILPPRQEVGSANPMQEMPQSYRPVPEVGSQNPMQEGRGSSYVEPGPVPMSQLDPDQGDFYDTQRQSLTGAGNKYWDIPSRHIETPSGSDIMGKGWSPVGGYGMGRTDPAGSDYVPTPTRLGQDYTSTGYKGDMIDPRRQRDWSMVDAREGSTLVDYLVNKARSMK
jgi:hypothetical protein